MFFIDFVGEKVHKINEAKRLAELEARARREKQGPDSTAATDVTTEDLPEKGEESATQDRRQLPTDCCDNGELDRHGG